MTPADRWRLQHMADAAELAIGFIAGRSPADLRTDPMLRLALTRAVEIVGEAAAQVTAEGRAELAGVPWAQIVGMRNRLVHAYFDVDPAILWDTVELALPGLRAQLLTALQAP
jgi:uncharacterized protein with HEPN domain